MNLMTVLLFLLVFHPGSMFFIYSPLQVIERK